MTMVANGAVERFPLNPKAMEFVFDQPRDRLGSRSDSLSAEKDSGVESADGDFVASADLVQQVVQQVER